MRRLDAGSHEIAGVTTDLIRGRNDGAIGRDARINPAMTGLHGLFYNVQHVILSTLIWPLVRRERS